MDFKKTCFVCKGRKKNTNHKLIKGGRDGLATIAKYMLVLTMKKKAPDVIDLYELGWNGDIADCTSIVDFLMEKGAYYHKQCYFEYCDKKLKKTSGPDLAEPSLPSASVLVPSTSSAAQFLQPNVRPYFDQNFESLTLDHYQDLSPPTQLSDPELLEIANNFLSCPTSPMFQNVPDFRKVCFQHLEQIVGSSGSVLVYTVTEIHNMFKNILKTLITNNEDLLRRCNFMSDKLFTHSVLKNCSRITCQFESMFCHKDNFAKIIRIIHKTNVVGNTVPDIKTVRKDIEECSKAVDGKFDGELTGNDMSTYTPESLISLLNYLLYKRSDNKSNKITKNLSSLIMFNHKKRNTKFSESISRRAQTKNENPNICYNSLNIYRFTQSRFVVDALYKEGQSLSYERLRDIVKSLAEQDLRCFQKWNVVVPTSSRQGVFTIFMKDNLDQNKTCVRSKDHFHGTSQSVVQYPRSADGSILVKKEEYTEVKKIVTPLIQSYNFDVAAGHVSISKRTPVCLSNVNTIDLDSQLLKDGRLTVHEWLSYASTATIDDKELSNWPGYISSLTNIADDLDTFGILPLHKQSSNSYAMMRHTMDLAIAGTQFLNPGQTTVDVGDLPLYSRCKEIQLNHPLSYGPAVYIPILGGLHVQKMLLLVFADLVKGTGLIDVLNSCKELTVDSSGTALESVSCIGRSKYLLEVVAVTLFKLRVDAYSQSNVSHTYSDHTYCKDTIDRWSKSRASESDNFQYWLQIEDFTELFLIF